MLSKLRPWIGASEMNPSYDCSGIPAELIRQLKVRAFKGHRKAMWIYGLVLYFRGKENVGLSWIRLAAQRGNESAMTFLLRLF